MAGATRMILRIGDHSIWCPACGDVSFRCQSTVPELMSKVTCLGCKKKFIYRELARRTRSTLAEFIEHGDENASVITVTPISLPVADVYEPSEEE